MKLTYKIPIDLLEFIKSGRFDYIKLGQTKEWILNNFPDPDGFAESPEVSRHPIWQYGNIKFHFTQDQLTLIYSDYIDTLDGGESLELYEWIFTEPRKLTLAYVTAQLNQQRISFTTKHQTQGDTSGASLTILESNVTLGFAPAEHVDEPLSDLLERHRTEDSNLFRLCSLSLGR
jgi:hypothetical protein